MEHLKGYHFSRSIDLGCGSGDGGELLRSHTGYLIGVDIDQNALKIARERGFYDELHLADIREFPLDNADSIFLFDSLEHVPKECGYRLLKKCEEKFTMITTPFWNFINSNPDHKCTWSARELEGLGFEVQGYSFFPDIGMCVSYGGFFVAIRRDR
jgi:2-polyprenyl-3-methyl-5-hydroxy-6-metoxy-1,4-benzoquinol methylase